jgi:hypothetical protein
MVNQTTTTVRRTTVHKCCGFCVHYFALRADYRWGTCHAAPPSLIDSLRLDPALPDPQADDLAQLRWPSVHFSELCGAFTWKCQDEDCRQPAQIMTEADLRAGRVYCFGHHRPAAA